MLGWYLITILIGHKLCSILNIKNKLKVQKVQHFLTNNVFWTRKEKQQQNNNKIKSKHKNPRPGLESKPLKSRPVSCYLFQHKENIYK